MLGADVTQFPDYQYQTTQPERTLTTHPESYATYVTVILLELVYTQRVRESDDHFQFYFVYNLSLAVIV